NRLIVLPERKWQGPPNETRSLRLAIAAQKSVEQRIQPVQTAERRKRVTRTKRWNHFKNSLNQKPGLQGRKPRYTSARRLGARLTPPRQHTKDGVKQPSCHKNYIP